MKKSVTEQMVLEIVSKISGKEIKNIDLNGDIKDELTLDSIQIVELFISLEKKLEVELPLQMMTVKTCNEFLELLENQVQQKVVLHP
jgi:acyl carrier protein